MSRRPELSQEKIVASGPGHVEIVWIIFVVPLSVFT